MTLSAEETEDAGEKLGRKLYPGAIITMEGPLGSGKTTFVKGVARALGISQIITSPSFTIVSEYYGNMPLYHMDLYRIDSIEEFELIGPEEMLDGSGVSIIEWADKAEGYFRQRHINVFMSIQGSGKRSINIEGIDW